MINIYFINFALKFFLLKSLSFYKTSLYHIFYKFMHKVPKEYLGYIGKLTYKKGALLI